MAEAERKQQQESSMSQLRGLQPPQCCPVVSVSPGSAMGEEPTALCLWLRHKIRCHLGTWQSAMGSPGARPGMKHRTVLVTPYPGAWVNAGRGCKVPPPPQAPGHVLAPEQLRALCSLDLHIPPARLRCQDHLQAGRGRSLGLAHPAPCLFSRHCLDVADGWSEAEAALPGATILGPPCPHALGTSSVHSADAAWAPRSAKLSSHRDAAAGPRAQSVPRTVPCSWYQISLSLCSKALTSQRCADHRYPWAPGTGAATGCKAAAGASSTGKY